MCHSKIVRVTTKTVSVESYVKSFVTRLGSGLSVGRGNRDVNQGLRKGRRRGGETVRPRVETEKSGT